MTPTGTPTGELAGYVARWDKPDGGKAINLPELRERSDDPVLVVKGEKTSDAIRALIPSSCPITSMGEGAAPERLEAPDGRRYAREDAALVRPYCAAP